MKEKQKIRGKLKSDERQLYAAVDQFAHIFFLQKDSDDKNAVRFVCFCNDSCLF